MAYNSMSVVRQYPYAINRNNGFGKKKNEELESSTEKPQQQQQPHHNESYEREPQKDMRQQFEDSKASHQKALAARDANLKNATVNIAQILKDFRNTAIAIGSPDELTDEVNTYLALVEKQATKETPDTKIIRTNLKNASLLLDGYITETLQRPSTVVENWIDALFLQQINYKFNEEEINENFLVKFPNQQKEGKRVDIEIEENNSLTSQTPSEKVKVYIPENNELKNLFIQAKKYSYTDDSKKALEAFKAALDKAIELQDKETESKVLFEIGKIYDKNDYLAQALTSYSKSLTATKDTNVKTQAHFSMAKIYDDVAQFEPAINHYMSSIAYAGEAENINAQTTSLTKIGNIFADEYKKEAFDFLETAETLSKETDNKKIKGYVSSCIGNAYNKFNEPQNALRYYSSAVKEYSNAESPIKIAINYKKAAEIMHDFNNIPKAKKLYQKALVSARQSDDVQLIKEIHTAFSSI